MSLPLPDRESASDVSAAVASNEVGAYGATAGSVRPGIYLAGWSYLHSNTGANVRFSGDPTIRPCGHEAPLAARRRHGAHRPLIARRRWRRARIRRDRIHVGREAGNLITARVHALRINRCRIAVGCSFPPARSPARPCCRRQLHLRRRRSPRRGRRQQPRRVPRQARW